MRSQAALVLGILLLWLSGQQAKAAQQRPELTAKRVALVIGNSAYKNVPQLRNPVSDAAAIGDMFKSAGFDVVEIRQNLANGDLRRTINNFYDTARNADIAVVYYAGHGIEVDGSNYIIPTDAVLERDRDVYDEALSLDRILQSIEPARQLRLVLLDACRDNPFAKGMRRSFASRGGISRGLARVDPDTPNTLIAFAAKAGSTADDGSGSHSPFTTSLLKHLTVPGVDLRKALGLVRDEVISATANRQEPFVFGSLGGADVSLVPAPTPVNLTPSVSLADIRTDYELAERVGTMEVWDSFLAAHGTGFYADLAKAQRRKLAAAHVATADASLGMDIAQPSDQASIKVATLSNQTPAPAEDSPGGAKVIPPNVIAPGREPTTKEALDWDKVKDSTDQSALQSFIKRYPNSPLSINAQQRLDVLKRAAEEREAKARADREAAAKAAEEARIQAEQKKAELAAAKKREEEERRAKAAEAEQKAKAEAAEKKAAEAKQRAEEAERAKAAAAEAAAAKKREEDERRAKAAEAEQNAKAAAAEKKMAEEKQKAEEAERKRAAAELEALRAASEKLAKQAEAERKKAELAAAQEAACQKEQTRFDELSAKGSEGAGLDDLRSFSKASTCDRLRPQLEALLAKVSAEAAKRAAEMPNSPELIRAAQTQLARIGCFSGKVDGVLSAANVALGRYATAKGSSSNPTAITQDVVAELTSQTARVCPLECKSGETAKGDVCVANARPAAPATASRHNKGNEEDSTPARSRRPAHRQAERAAPAPQPQARQQALRPTGDGGGNSPRTMIGVGF